MIASMVRLLESDKARGAEANKQIAHEAGRMRDMQRRLGWKGDEGKDIIGATLAQRLRGADEQTDKNNAMMVLVDRAIAHVRLYGWETDPVAQPAAYFYDFTRMKFHSRTFANFIFTSSDKPFSTEPATDRRWFPIMPKPLLKPRKRRKALMSDDGLYRRPHTCTLDAEGKQVPPPRGSWGEFERRAAAL